MSTTPSPGYRDGIWEIGQNAVTAHFPEGDWHLPACDIESIRLQYGEEDGLPVCDAFLKARGSARSDLLGRYAAGKDRLCIELALFAARNRILLLGAPVETGAGQALTTVASIKKEPPEATGPETMSHTESSTPDHTAACNNQTIHLSRHSKRPRIRPDSPHRLNPQTTRTRDSTRILALGRTKATIQTKAMTRTRATIPTKGMIRTWAMTRIKVSDQIRKAIRVRVSVRIHMARSNPAGPDFVRQSGGAGCSVP